MKLVYTVALGAAGIYPVEVRVLSPAQLICPLSFESFESAEFNPERALEQEEKILGEHKAMVLLKVKVERHTKNKPKLRRKKRIEIRTFKGYGIETKQKVEVDEDGNVIRVLETETPA